MKLSNIVSNELANVIGVLSHPQRIQIIGKLSTGEKDVNQLTTELHISQSRVSQHLSVMRSKHIVEERKEGRHVFYHLCHPKISEWLLQGLFFVSADIEKREQIIYAIEETLSVITKTAL
ncbi:MAG: metalloregulator ArsR/SmtB family transcription factor [Cyanobacteriota bacterium]